MHGFASTGALACIQTTIKPFQTKRRNLAPCMMQHTLMSHEAAAFALLAQAHTPIQVHACTAHAPLLNMLGSCALPSSIISFFLKKRATSCFSSPSQMQCYSAHAFEHKTGPVPLCLPCHVLVVDAEPKDVTKFCQVRCCVVHAQHPGGSQRKSAVCWLHGMML
eukprot:1148445-Pelagomonas_calceolata.AAC.2